MTLVELRTARIDHSEKAGAGGKIESILRAGAFTVPEADRPQSRDRDGRPVAVGEPAKRRTGRGIERVDVAVKQVPHQQVVAELSEVGGSHGQSPGCEERAATDQVFDEVAAGIKHVDSGRALRKAKASRPERRVDLPIDVLDAEGGIVRRKRGIREGTDPGERR